MKMNRKINALALALICALLGFAALLVLGMVASHSHAQTVSPAASGIPPGCGGDVAVLANPIVYTAAPRNLVKPNDPWQDASTLQIFSDVAFLTQGFGESDVEVIGKDLKVKKIYDCTTSTKNCAAQDAKTSPNGKLIAFSVTFAGTLWTHNSNKTTHLGDPINSKIFIYNVDTEAVTQIPNQSASVINRTPDWIDDDTLVMASNGANLWPVRDQWNCHGGVYPEGHPRAGQKRGYNNGECVSQAYPYSASGKAMQIWRINIDGTGQKNLTPQEANAIRPSVLRHPRNKGRIAYSSWQNQEDRGYYQGSAGPGTVVNRWWIMTMATDGTSPTVLVGGHHSGYLNKNAPQANFQQIEEWMALRAVGETPDGKICFTNYYRGNHMGGMGTTWCMTPPFGDFQVEGCLTQACYAKSFFPTDKTKGPGMYVPPDVETVASFGVGSDNDQNINAEGKTVGATGYISPMSNGHIMASWCRGWCYIAEGGMPRSPGQPGFDGTSASIGGEPLADLNIVEFLVPRVTDPFDKKQMRILVGDPLKHEFDGSEVVARPISHVQPPIDESKGCYLEVVDIRNAEVYPPKAGPFKWNMRAELVGIQGNSVNPYQQDVKASDGSILTPSFHRKNVKSLGIWGVQLHTTMYKDPKFMNAVNYTGWESVWYMGKQDMMSDGSLKMQVPCEQPFFMSALDDRGRWITHDPFLHSLQKGETKTCHGCHDGHSVERRSELGRDPQQRWLNSDAENTKAVLAHATNPPLINGRQIVAFSQVAPIITKACAGCHEGFQNDSLLWSRVFADQEQLDFPWMKRHLNHNGTYALPRPYFSGLAARYWRWSMLGWIVDGSRLDGFANAQFSDDQDFPVGHPAIQITPEERNTLLMYLQQGAPRQ